MIRFKLKELIAEKEYKDKKRLSIKQISEATGIGRTTLSKIVNQKAVNTTLENIDKLCQLFDCKIQDLVIYEKSED